MTSKIDTIVTRILVENFHVSAGKIRSDTALTELGLDSLALMEFVFALEDAFQLRIPESLLQESQGDLTLGHLKSVIHQLQAPET